MTIKEVFPSVSYDFDTLVTAYQKEIDGLGYLAETGKLKQWLPRFADYSAYLSSLGSWSRSLKKIDKITRGSRIIDCYAQNKWLNDALLMAHLASICYLLNGMTLLENSLSRQILRSLPGRKLEQFRFASYEKIHPFFCNFHTIDAIRTIQILRCLGLVNTKSNDIRLLGLGVGDGHKELVDLHMTPSIDARDTLNGKALTFHSIKESFHDAIVFDSDPQHREYFKTLTQKAVPPVVAVNDGSVAGVEALGGLLVEQDMQPRNFVSMLRIDHRMIPDAKSFLRALLQHVQEGCDLALSIGSGHNLEQYQERTNKIREVFEILSQAGMRPIIIKLHKEDKSADAGVQPMFGIYGISTFEILHCKLLPTSAERI